MSEYVKKTELKIGHWYSVQQGSVMIPMKLIAWSGTYKVFMETRTGSERELMVTKIREGWDPDRNEPLLLPKTGEPEEPKQDDSRRAELLRQAANPKPNSTAHKVLAIFEELVEPASDEVALDMINASGENMHPSTFRGCRSLLAQVGYLSQALGVNAESRTGRPVKSHQLSDRGRAKLANLNERAA